MKKIISLLLSVLFLTSALFSINVFAEESDYNSMLDFRDGNYLAMSKKMTFAEIAAQIGNKTCTASELVFLNNKYGEFEMEYGYAIPSGHVNVIKVSENEIRVEAQSYSYTAENGKNVTWIPVNASYRQGVTKLSEEDGRYVGTIKNIEFDQKFYATVRYIAEIQIPYEIYSVIVNEAFRVGFETSAIISAYDFEMGIYNNQLKNYNQYLKDMEEYDLAMTKYLEDSGIYSKWVIDKAEYDEYLLKKAAFDYNELLKTNYAEMYAEWQQYSISKSLCENFLTTMDTVFEKKPDLGNGVDGVSMAHMITGTGLKIVYDRVNSVGESTLKLMFGNAAKEFSNCEARLVVLTDLLNAYNTLSTREKMFNWYKTNYAVYKENIHSLYNSMNIILNNKSFSWAMEAANLTPEQQVKIKRFVFYLGAYDTALVNPNDPTDYKWPAFVAEPGKPDYSMIEPYPVADPGVVEEPISPEKPKDVNPPSKKPEDLVLSDIEKALAEDVDKERLTEKVIVKDYVTIINDVVAQVSNESSAITLLFMDYDGSVLTRAELDSDFDPSSITPNFPDDPMYSYKFEGWQDGNGNAMDFTSITSSCVLYPKSSKTIRTYSVTWITAKGSFVDTIEYGKVPSFTGDTSKDEDDSGIYSFAGWDKQIGPVTADVTYTAKYEQNAILYKVTWTYNGHSITSNVVKGRVPTCPQSPQSFIDSIDGISADKYTKFVGWDKEITSAEYDVEYIAITETSWLVPMSSGNDGDLTMGAEVTKDNDEWKIKIRGEDLKADLSYIINKTQEDKSKVSIEIGKDIIAIPSNSAKYLSELNGVSFYYKSHIDNGTFNAIIDISDQNGKEVNVSGITISFIFDTNGVNYNAYCSADGINYVKCNYYDSNGMLSFITDGNSKYFKLEKAEDVIVDATYNISFYANGTLLQTGTYKTGEAINPPVPENYSDEKYNYTFIGWSPAFVNMAVGDATYEALFQRDLIKIGLPWFIILLIVLGSLLAVGIIAFVVLKILKKKKKQQMLNNKSKSNSQPVETEKKPFDTSNFGDTLQFSLNTENAKVEEENNKNIGDYIKKRENVVESNNVQSKDNAKKTSERSKLAIFATKALKIIVFPFKKLKAKIDEMKKEIF